MPGRVLNFLEFSDKYSNGNDDQINLDDIKNASSNFEEGFDDDTYDQPQIGANRPISGDYEMTPASPGEEGVPSFSAENSEDMSAPADTDEESTELPPATSEEDEEEDEDDTNTEDDNDSEEGNPEAGANPKKKVDEGITLIKGFMQFINENADHCEECGDPISDDDDIFIGETCKSCGEKYELDEDHSISCGCNM